MRSERGLSMIEVLIGMALIVLAVAYFVESLSNTGNEFMNLSDRLVANQLLQERVSNLKMMAGQFPPVKGPNGKFGMYVACSDRHAVPTPDAKGRPLEAISFTAKSGESSGLCPASEVETQFLPSATDPANLEVVVLLYSKRGSLLSTHRQTVRLERNL
jgi:hypothetical protein